MPASVEEVAERLLDAFNGRDILAVMALIDDDVEFDFGNKTLHGRQEVRDFVERQLFGAGYRAAHRRRFQRGDEPVVESRQELTFLTRLKQIDERPNPAQPSPGPNGITPPGEPLRDSLP